jgi:hypothetical protein
VSVRPVVPTGGDFGAQSVKIHCCDNIDPNSSTKKEEEEEEEKVLVLFKILFKRRRRRKRHLETLLNFRCIPF